MWFGCIFRDILPTVAAANAPIAHTNPKAPAIVEPALNGGCSK